MMPWVVLTQCGLKVFKACDALNHLKHCVPYTICQSGLKTCKYNQFEMHFFFFVQNKIPQL